MFRGPGSSRRSSLRSPQALCERPAGTAAFYVPAASAVGSVVLLALGLVGLYLRQEERFGAFGAASFPIALFGTILAAGGQWTYVFVIPHFAGAVPELVNEGTGSVLAGFVLSYAVLALGWILFSLATLRAAIFPRWTPCSSSRARRSPSCPCRPGRSSWRSPQPLSAGGFCGTPAQLNRGGRALPRAGDETGS